MSLTPTIYTGTFIHTPHLNELEVLENHAIFVDEKGVIVRIVKLSDDEGENAETIVRALARELGGGWEQGWTVVRNEAVSGGRRRWWCPGFVGRYVSASPFCCYVSTSIV